MHNYIKKKWKIILPLTIGVLIGSFLAQTNFWTDGIFFYDLGHSIGEWIGSILF